MRRSSLRPIRQHNMHYSIGIFFYYVCSVGSAGKQAKGLVSEQHQIIIRHFKNNKIATHFFLLYILVDGGRWTHISHTQIHE